MYILISCHVSQYTQQNLRAAVFFFVRWTGRLTAECSLRLIKPECHLSCDWNAEPLDSQFRRAVALLYDETVPRDAVGLLPAPSFTYCFQLLKLVLSRIKEKDESLSLKCLQIMSTHASKLRASKTVKGVDEASNGWIYCNFMKLYFFFRKQSMQF